MTQERKIRVSRADSREVECPDCGAAVGQPCLRPIDQIPSHASRHEAAAVAGFDRVDSQRRKDEQAA
jgi:hypothetical protein